MMSSFYSVTNILISIFHFFGKEHLCQTFWFVNPQTPFLSPPVLAIWNNRGSNQFQPLPCFLLLTLALNPALCPRIKPMVSWLTLSNRGRGWFVAFANFHGINTSQWSISSYLPDVTEHGIRKRCTYRHIITQYLHYSIALDINNREH